MTRGALFGWIAGALAVGACACAPARPRLPAGPWSPSPEAVGWFTAAAARCGGVRTMTAEVAVSGRVGRARLRGRLIAGLERPAAVRLEAPAPFGAPVFILAARGDDAVLYFPRDRRAVTRTGVADVLEALAGIRRSAGDLQALLSGCLVAERHPANGRTAGGSWAQVDLGGGVAAFLKRRDGHWVIAGGRQTAGGAGAARQAWEVEYAETAAGFPRTIRFSSGSDDGRGTTLGLTVSQLDTNVPIDPAAFELTVPSDTIPMSLDELRQMGPLADRNGDERR